MQQEQLLNVLKELTTIEGVSDGLKAMMLKMAADSITLSTLQTLLPNIQQPQEQPPAPQKEKRDKSSKVGFKLTKKEIKELPTYLSKVFACKDLLIPYRFHKGVYEAHYRGQGLNVYACSKHFDEMKRKFIAKLNEIQEQSIQPAQAVQTAEQPQQTVKGSDALFSDYVEQWLEIKKKTTKPSTYKEYERLCSYNLINAFCGKKISDMTRAVIQKYLFSIVDEGKNRTANKLMQILTSILDLACEDFAIASPMKKIVLPCYETKKGSALTKEEESKLVNFCKDNPDNAASSALLVLLYFGLRKSEIASISVENDKLTCVTSKTRLGKGIVKRTIPFTPIFRKVLPYVDFEKARTTNIHTIDTALKRILPERHTHELRYNFITRAKECGVAGEVVMIWDGHTYDKDVKTSVIDRGYTTYSEEFILKEAQKVDYDLP